MLRRALEACIRPAAFLKSLCFLSVLAILKPAASAEVYDWRNVEIGGGGFVTGTVFHPRVAGLVYARTDVGGIYRLDPATERWKPLNDDVGGLGNEFQHLGVLSIGLDPSDAERVYITTGQYSGSDSWKLYSRLYRSTNRGDSWQPYLTLPFKMAGNGEARGTAERFAVDPANGANLLIGSSSDGIWRSTDYGATWARLAGFTPTMTNFVLYVPRPAGASGPSRVYASAATLTGPSLWYSDDNGTTWVSVANQPGRVLGAELMAVQGSFDGDGVFYTTWSNAAGPNTNQIRGQVWKLAADGVTWTQLVLPGGQGGFSGVSADPRVPGHVIVSTLHRWWPGDEVYRSVDGGLTWTGVLRSATRKVGNSPWSLNATPHWITDVEIDPFDSERAIFNTGYGLFATRNLSSSGLSRTWTFYNDGLEELVPLGLLSPQAGPPLVSVTGDYTGFRHDNLTRSPLRGRHSPGNGTNVTLIGPALASPRMLRQSSTQTHVSDDYGASWASIGAVPHPTMNGRGELAYSADGQRLVWCPPNAPAYLSLDHGASWSMITGSASVRTDGAVVVSTLAGSPGTAGAVNASGSDARFSSPAGIAVGLDGTRYVADTANHTIRRIVVGAAVNNLAGSAGLAGNANGTGSAARFSAPRGLAVDAQGNVYVADTNNHTVRKITPTGAVTTLAGTAGLSGSVDGAGAAARFNAPRGIAVDAAGNVYVADTGNHVIRFITPAGAVSTLAGLAGSPGAINGTAAESRFSSPGALAVDFSGNLYVADTGNHTLRRITPAGAVSLLAGAAGVAGSTNGGAALARFNSPGGLACDGAGVLYVADTGNQLLRKITPAGVVSTLAGSAGVSGTASGTGANARFNAPAGVATDPDGFNVYVADSGNHAIRRGIDHYSLQPLADAVDAQRFYLWDSSTRTLRTSTNGAASFTVAATGVNSAFSKPEPAPGAPGHLWVRAGASGLYRSTDYGTSFVSVPGLADIYQLGFGCPAPGTAYPTLFIWGKVGTVVGFYRSTDQGANWTRINDAQHQFGNISKMIGDPRVYGRVYLSTSGRGVVYGESAETPAPVPQATALLYDDALRNGWVNASPAGVVLGSSAPLRRGSAAIAIPAGSGQGAVFTSEARSTLGYAALSFWVCGDNAAPPPLQIGASRGGVQLEAVPVTLAPQVGWQRVLVPLAEIGVANIDDLSGLRIESRTESGVVPSAFSLDDPALVGSADYATLPGAAEITLSGLTTTYDGAPQVVTVTTNPIGLPTLITYGNAASAPTAAGNYAVNASVDHPLAWGAASGTLVIAKASQVITFAQPDAHVYGDAPFPLTAAASSGLTVTIAAQAGPATVTAGTVTLTGTGTVTLRATQGGDANYLAAPAVERSFSVATDLSTPSHADGLCILNGSTAETTLSVLANGLVPASAVWSQQSGPGVATFATPAMANTAVQFSAPGFYVLRCTVTDQFGTVSSVEVSVVNNPWQQHTLRAGENGYNHLGTFIRADNPTQNSGARDQFVVGRTTAAMRALLSFDLATLPARPAYAAASLDLWTYPDQAGSRTVGTLQLRALSAVPQEGTGNSSSDPANGAGTGATWQRRTSTVSWTTPGGDLAPGVLGSVPGFSSAQLGVQKTFATNVELVDQLQSVSDSGLPLSLAVLSPTTESGATNVYVRFASDDYPDTTRRPRLNLTLKPGVPAPWVAEDIGTVGLSGSASLLGDAYVVAGAGADIWASADAFHFLHQAASGDCVLTTRLAAQAVTHSTAKAGLMIRETSAPDAREIMLAATPSGLYLQWRSSTAAATTQMWVHAAEAPVWLRLTRTGNTFRGYTSPNGVDWTPVGTEQSIAMASTTRCGMAVCSKNPAEAGHAVFTDVSLAP